MNPLTSVQTLAIPVPRSASRLGPLPRAATPSAAELAVLFAAGSLAATAVAFVSLGLRIPGHKILLAALPTMAGLMLVPRRFSGMAMTLSAAATLGCFYLGGVGRLQPAAVFPLLALGPVLDLALLGTPRTGWMLYARCAAAGLAANLGAYLVRWGIALWSFDTSESHALKEFGWRVAGSFALCGLAAGLLSGIACFRWTEASPQASQDLGG